MAERHADELTLLAYVDGELPDDERQAVEGHVQTCPTCAVEAHRLEAGRDALRGTPLLELSEERRRAIVASLPERKERFGFFAPLRRLGPALPAAAA
ncbi:MAG: anti-sigma factor family protein, partial [Gaiellaceae bacterium]